ncbi:STAS domain-containing protein [Glycomyces artemisiae]|uniref:Anti-anti-sigma factor n=1 Tax=Glycomyces artemisiae TaxID=1076443 RepID=A0A2T0U694_9ACTN|nr:STAS domain-containing protein [Glycomyces artemisiae]PRY53431.1 anti-anti-sigma factor [Glycomyces artemisiae]
MTAEPAVDTWPLRIEECECHAGGIAIFGEIDLNGHAQWEHALRLSIGITRETHVHLAGLRFIDVRGVAMLVNIADELSGGKRVVVHDAPPGLHRVMEVLWSDSGAAIEIEGRQ